VSDLIPPSARSGPRATNPTLSPGPADTASILAWRGYAPHMNFTRDIALLAAVGVAIAGAAGTLVVRGLLAKVVVLAGAILIAAYIAGVLPPLPF
jgi:hypothetical protein